MKLQRNPAYPSATLQEPRARPDIAGAARSSRHCKSCALVPTLQEPRARPDTPTPPLSTHHSVQVFRELGVLQEKLSVDVGCLEVLRRVMDLVQTGGDERAKAWVREEARRGDDVWRLFAITLQ